MKANRDCALCMDPREDGPPHPYINISVMFDGPQNTTLHELIEEVEAFGKQLVLLRAGGGTICSRDGRHISYCPGDYDPWPMKEA